MARRRVDRGKELFWRRNVQGHEGSGLTIRAWCRRHHLKEPAFHWWRRELARRDGQPKFVPLEIRAAPLQAPCLAQASEAPIEIVLTGDRRIRLHGRVDREALAEVLAVLEASPC